MLTTCSGDRGCILFTLWDATRTLFIGFITKCHLLSGLQKISFLVSDSVPGVPFLSGTESEIRPLEVWLRRVPRAVNVDPNPAWIQNPSEQMGIGNQPTIMPRSLVKSLRGSKSLSYSYLALTSKSHEPPFIFPNRRRSAELFALCSYMCFHSIRQNIPFCRGSVGPIARRLLSFPFVFPLNLKPNL